MLIVNWLLCSRVNWGDNNPIPPSLNPAGEMPRLLAWLVSVGG